MNNPETASGPRQADLPHNIVLIGFMGSGKSSLGRHLAALIGFRCYDLDDIIEEMTGQTVPELFASQGEAYFRACERQAVASLEGVERAVIACGGGVVLAAANVARLKKRGKIVWLQAGPRTIYDRLRHEDNRPLLQGKGPEAIAAMLETRRHLYDAAADFAVATDDRPVDKVGDDILAALMGPAGGITQKKR